MSDIVERLREAIVRERATDYDALDAQTNLGSRAADEIETLRDCLYRIQKLVQGDPSAKAAIIQSTIDATIVTLRGEDG